MPSPDSRSQELIRAVSQERNVVDEVHEGDVQAVQTGWAVIVGVIVGIGNVIQIAYTVRASRRIVRLGERVSSLQIEIMPDLAVNFHLQTVVMGVLYVF